MNIGMSKSSSQYHEGLVDHHRIHGGTGDKDEQHKKDAAE